MQQRCGCRLSTRAWRSRRGSRVSPPARILAKPGAGREAGGASTPGPGRRYLPRRLRMALHADLTREIDEGPAGPAVGAFFDVDGTLIAGFSAVAFLRDRLASGRMRARDLADAILSTARFQLGRLGFSGLLAATAARPRPTNPNRRLAAIAALRGWPARRFTTRGTPGLTDVVRSSLALASIVPSFVLGAVPGVLNWSRRDMVNLAITTWGEFGTALAGVRLQVHGEEHLWSHRPAVFVFNHQSAIDMLLLCRLIRRDFVGVAKQEARRNPLFGPAFALAGTVFIDRFDRQRAIAALRPAIAALKAGTSLVIAPEGTRSPTPRLGPFKKGAFHMAMGAGVPIVPIVFRNSLDALPKHGLVIRPTTVEVVVHPPVPTEGWRVETLERHVAEVRALFVETLDE